MAQNPKSPAFQFYPADWLADGHVAAMSLAERGAYITLLCFYWRERTLPNDPIRLARLVGLSPAQFRKYWPAIAPCFSVDGDTLRQGRLDAERQKQDAFRAGQRQKGLASATARLQPDGSHAVTDTATEQQPNENHGSTAVQPNGQPNAKSSIFSLPSSLRPHGRTAARDGVMAGQLPRDHADHEACDPTMSWCVPRAVHTRLVAALAPKFGGNREQAGQALIAFYGRTWAGLAPDFVIVDAFKFWRARADAEFSTPDPAAVRKRPDEPRSNVPGPEETRRYMAELRSVGQS